MKVIFYGTYRKNYTANRVLYKGLTRCGATVYECQVDFLAETKWNKKTLKNPLSLLKLAAGFLWSQIRLAFKFLRLPKADFMLVGYPGQMDMPLAWLLSRIRKMPLVFYAFLSYYDTFIIDRKVASKNSLFAKTMKFLDTFSCNLADIVILDTQAHIDYFHETFGIPEEKMFRLFSGTDDDVFKPREVEKTTDKFVVIYFGYFIPLHGLEYIIEAAARLKDHEDIEFWMIGDGQEMPRIKALIDKHNLKNVILFGKKPLEELPGYIAQADVCLGVFGDTPKARRVIPYKFYESAAMKKVVITGESEAIKEALESGVHLVTVPMADPEAIASAIMELKQNPDMRYRIAENAHEIFKNRFAPEKTAEELLKRVKSLLETRN